LQQSEILEWGWNKKNPTISIVYGNFEWHFIFKLEHFKDVISTEETKLGDEILF